MGGGVGQLVEFIELVALSESRIKKSEVDLKEVVKSTASTLRRDCSLGVQDHIAAKLLQENDSEGQTIKMAMAILVNALVFHITIAKIEPGKVRNISKLRSAGGSLKDSISEEWRRISENINYRPIYDLAVDVLEPIGDGEAKEILNALIKVATKISELGVTSQHDFGGQLFQKLINDRKFLASFYTLPSSAAFIAELAVSRMKVRWTDRKAVTGLRIGDFACGTGALLSASYNAIRTRYRSEGADDSEIHKNMMEKVLVGFDIMPAATHLTTSVLSGAHPEIIFNKADIATMLYGDHAGLGRGGDLDESGEEKPETFIGSLELLSPVEADDMPLMPVRHMYHSGTEGKVEEKVEAGHESFDLVVMNPPFTRTTASDAEHKGVPNPAFAGFGTSKEEQDKMGTKRERIYRDRSRKGRGKNAPLPEWYRGKNDRAGEGRAGLAPWFIDLADVKVKPGGVVAFIIPATFSNGKLWEKARILLQARYNDILIVNIASSKQLGRSFSDDTGMAECIVIATRRLAGESSDAKFMVASIERRPASILEAIHFAKEIAGIIRPREGGSMLCIGSQIFGRINHFPKSMLSKSGIGSIQDSDVEETAIMLRDGRLCLPHLSRDIELPIVHLKELGYRRQHANYINGKGIKPPWGPFDTAPLGGGVPKYPMLWGHEADADTPGRESRLIVEPDSQGIVRREREEDAKEYWKTYSSRLCFNQDFQLSSQRLAACMTRKKVIGGSAWPAFICNDQRWSEPIALWMNTTLGLITFWFKGTRQQKERSRVKITALDTLPIYDMRELTDAQIELAKHIFKEFAALELLQASAADSDPVRQDMDRAVLVNLFGLPEDIMEPLELLRRKWCMEPSVNDPDSASRRRRVANDLAD